MRALAPLLEAYVDRYRPLLVGGVDPGTLFLNRHGGIMTKDTFARHIGDITAHYGHRRVSPSAFQAIFGLHWLERNPGRFEALATILWWNISSVRARFDPEYRSHKLTN
jgi:hypothetical protein